MAIHSKEVLLFSLALLAAASSRAGEIDGEVGFLASPVSLSVSGSQPVATYTVTLTNTSASNTINNGRLVATTTVGGAPDAKAVFKSASGATCSTNADGTRVDCSVGSLTVTESKQFTLTFFSPTSGTSIDLAWDAVFDAGTPPGGSNGDFGSTSIGLAAPDPTRVTSAVPGDAELQVFTGNLAVPTGLDQFTVAITVPPVNTQTTATVVEADVSSTNLTCASLRNFKKCYEAEISIPNVLISDGGFLTSVLRVDKSNIRGGSKIGKVVVQYVDDLTVPPVVVPIVQYCLKDGNGNAIPNNDVPPTPCIARVNDYSRKASPQGWFGYEFVFFGKKNGRITLL